ncbi:transcriptional regulator [Nocardioides sp.]|uniref:transcriptional regulator n=1 Tax=Nocardioides sp. TaxID=35761 RepID=UPI002B2778D3|nr:transcriptional regulator [Nocardioides sp.]
MYDDSVRRRARRLRTAGGTVSEVAQALHVSRSTIRSWETRPSTAPPHRCPRCDGRALDASGYSALLGYYLGDGCLSRAARYSTLRISCDTVYPGVIDDVSRCVASVRQGPVHLVPAPGCTVVQAGWKHWPCLFPQHGPGRKHERPIVLEPWQREIVEQHPAEFLRGLFHSDGSRVRNWARRPVAGELKRYDYPRWQFSNTSADIRDLCGWALNLVDVAWRASSTKHVSVSRRAAVARLDEVIGPKA